MFVKRENGKIVAAFSAMQTGVAEEELQDGDAELLAFLQPSIDLSAYAAQKRWEREVGGIEFAGLTVATDDRSKIMISGARIKADKDPAFVTSWKGPDGQFLTLDAETIISISDAVLDHVNDCFALEASVLVQIAEGGIVDADGVDAAFDG
jgi:hypothetical protein